MPKIAVLPGDGIGPEIMVEALKVLKVIGEQYHMLFEVNEYPVGGYAIDHFGEPLPDTTLEHCLQSDAVLLGAVGGPKWDDLPGESRPEKALLGLRKELKLFSNLRPVKVYDPLVEASTIKPEVIQGVDLLVIRELTGGIYFGERTKVMTEKGIKVSDTLTYTEEEMERIIRLGFETAMKRNKKLASVDKANILESSRVWRKIVNTMAKEYPEVEVQHVLVDNCAMQLIRNPKQFDVIVTENMFGDILSDEAAMLTGSIGMLPSASIGTEKVAMYEPIHGSAPDIAGLGIANPLATILSLAMMLKYSFHMNEAATQIEQAVDHVLQAGYRTKDLATNKIESTKLTGTKEMGDLVVQVLKGEFIS
ncbi:3-isopropylmalate dehydrogenase [Tepidibacillus decaturensis]|uniref:3-isopropylmalate dehydrogenase n=1 Tax=Tepidibacillus decaturensis TaxID=1413211 RepID=A0A135L4Z8_9BACI|nr:3-isopropylmalate dehydrogenase [Tepidibacillus decaturensis]KXG44036.1 3-isopropylmalate dehydrogenase [Tepidibacillus decaturensis]